LQLNWALVPPLVERTRLKSIMAKTCFLLSVILNEVVLILPQFCRKLKLSQRRKERMPRTTHELPLLDLRTHAIHSLGTTQVTATLAILLELLDILLLPTVVTIIILHLLELLLADLLVVLLLIQAWAVLQGKDILQTILQVPDLHLHTRPTLDLQEGPVVPLSVEPQAILPTLATLDKVPHPQAGLGHPPVAVTCTTEAGLATQADQDQDILQDLREVPQALLHQPLVHQELLHPPLHSPMINIRRAVWDPQVQVMDPRQVRQVLIQVHQVHQCSLQVQDL